MCTVPEKVPHLQRPGQRHSANLPLLKETSDICLSQWALKQYNITYTLKSNWVLSSFVNQCDLTCPDRHDVLSSITAFDLKDFAR